MTTFRTVLPGINRAPRINPIRNLGSDEAIGTVSLFAGNPGRKWLKMGDGTSYNAVSYPRLLAMIDAQFLNYSEFGALFTRTGSELDSANEFIGILLGVGQEVALYNDSPDSIVRSTNAGESFSETYPAPSVSANVRKSVSGQAGRVHVLGSGTQRLITFSPPFAAANIVEASHAGTLNGIGADGAGSVLAVGTSSNYRLSTDNGDNWAASGVTVPAATMNDTCWTGLNWVIVNTTTAYRGTDLASWNSTAFSSSFGSSLACISDGDGGVLVVDSTGKVAFSDDHGATFSTVTDVTSGSTDPRLCAMWTGQDWWLAGDHDKKSADGTTWVDATDLSGLGGTFRHAAASASAGVYELRSTGLTVLPFEQSTFRLVPPTDAADQLPAEYYVKAR